MLPSSNSAQVRILPRTRLSPFLTRTLAPAEFVEELAGPLGISEVRILLSSRVDATTDNPCVSPFQRATVGATEPGEASAGSVLAKGLRGGRSGVFEMEQDGKHEGREGKSEGGMGWL